MHRTLRFKMSWLGGLAALLGAGLLLVTRLHGQAQLSTLFDVLSPQEGQVYAPGDTIIVTIQPKAGVVLRIASVTSSIGLVEITQAPFTMRLLVPQDRLGPAALLITGIPQGGNGQSVYRNIEIQTAIPLLEIKLSPHTMRLVASGTSTLFPSLSQGRLIIRGRYADGVERDITYDAQTAIVADNTTVATVDPSGVVTAVAPGQTIIRVSNRGIIASAVVTVNVFELQGDLNGDGKVDQDDLKLILMALNTNATGPGDPRDLNNDGRIDILDLQVLDKVPPVISGMPAAGCTLWPPNNKLVQVGVVTASDALSGLAPGSFKVTGSSNEASAPDEQDVVITPLGFSGPTTNGAPGFIVQLRAARSGGGTGRIYTLTATATDLAGNTAKGTTTCTVPHDQGHDQGLNLIRDFGWSKPSLGLGQAKDSIPPSMIQVAQTMGSLARGQP